MGADFIFAIADITDPEDTWLAKADNHIQLFMDNYDAMYRWDDLNDDELAAAVTSELKDAITTCYHYNGREMGWFSPDGITTYALTGGMSWGDSPTDIYDHITDIYDHISMFADFQTIVERGT